MRCRCGERMQVKTIEFRARLRGSGRRVFVQNVPAWECPLCGAERTDRGLMQALGGLLGPDAAARSRVAV